MKPVTISAFVDIDFLTKAAIEWLQTLTNEEFEILKKDIDSGEINESWVFFYSDDSLLTAMGSPKELVRVMYDDGPWWPLKTVSYNEWVDDVIPDTTIPVVDGDSTQDILQVIEEWRDYIRECVIYTEICDRLKKTKFNGDDRIYIISDPQKGLVAELNGKKLVCNIDCDCYYFARILDGPEDYIEYLTPLIKEECRKNNYDDKETEFIVGAYNDYIRFFPDRWAEFDYTDLIDELKDMKGIDNLVVPPHIKDLPWKYDENMLKEIFEYNGGVYSEAVQHRNENNIKNNIKN